MYKAKYGNQPKDTGGWQYHTNPKRARIARHSTEAKQKEANYAKFLKRCITTKFGVPPGNENDWELVGYPDWQGLKPTPTKAFYEWVQKFGNLKYKNASAKYYHIYTALKNPNIARSFSNTNFVHSIDSVKRHRLKYPNVLVKVPLRIK
jgi:hypothetical protein